MTKRFRWANCDRAPVALQAVARQPLFAADEPTGVPLILVAWPPQGWPCLAARLLLVLPVWPEH